MTEDQSTNLIIEALADDYARSQEDRSRPISVAAGIRAVRLAQQGSMRSDNELGSIIAERAMRYGHSVDFDSG